MLTAKDFAVIFWRALRQGCKIRIWDDQAVVYDGYSGNTHCLDRLATAILCRLGDRDRASAAELRGDLAGGFAALDGAEGEQTLLDVLEELRGLGLARRIES